MKQDGFPDTWEIPDGAARWLGVYACIKHGIYMDYVQSGLTVGQALRSHGGAWRLSANPEAYCRGVPVEMYHVIRPGEIIEIM